jgi:starch synthase
MGRTIHPQKPTNLPASSGSDSLRVIQATWGKFHHFDLARQLEQRGLLEAIFSTYPRFKLRGEMIPLRRIRCRWLWQAPLLALWRYGLNLGRIEPWWKRQLVRDFERWLCRNLPKSDVLIALSGSGLAAGRRIKQQGGAYICDRASTHIRWGDRILKDEYGRWGQQYLGTDPTFVAREEEEYNEADLITVPSTFSARSFVEEGVSSRKIRIVPFGVELQQFNRVAEPSKEEFQVLFVGRVSFRKGVPYLLEAFRSFSHPRKKLTIIGLMSGEMRQWLSTRSFEHVDFLGALPQKELPRYMSRSHVHVLASIEEGMAYVQAQALACGVPLISSRHTGADDLIKDGREGFIVPIRDPNAICLHLEQLADDPALRNRMSEAAQRCVRGLAGWNSYGNLMTDVISEAQALAHTRKR